MPDTTTNRGTSREPDDSPETALAAELKRESGSRRGCIIGCLGMILLLFSIPVIGFLVWSSVAEKEVAIQLDAIRAKGEPTTIAELETFYALPDGTEDTSELWIRACKSFQNEEYWTLCEHLPVVGDAEGEIPSAGEPWEDLESVEAFLKQYQQSMDLMHAAGAKGGQARFDLPFEEGFDMSLEQIQQLRAGARMLYLEAHARAHRGDIAGTMESLRSLFAVGRALEHDPVIVSQLVQIALDGLAIGAMMELLPHVKFSDAQLAELQTLVRRPDYKKSLKTGILGERALGMEEFQNPEKRQYEMAPKIHITPWNDDLCLYLDFMTKMADSLDGSWVDAIETSDQLEQEIGVRNASFVPRIRYVYTTSFLPATQAVVLAGARADAFRSPADVILATERFHLAQNVYPEKIQQLVPEYLPAVPIDPFDGNPIRYELRSEKPVVWSIGQNRVDDDGFGDWSGMKDGELKDIVLTLSPSENDKP